MKRIIRKISVIALAISMLLSFSASAYADALIEKNEESIYSTLLEEGFRIDERTDIKDRNFDGEKIIIIGENTASKNLKAEGEGILTDGDGRYYIEINDKTYVEASAVSSSLYDQNKIKSFLSNNSFEQETIDDINNMALKARETDNRDAIVTVYTSIPSRFTYKGYEMKSEFTSYTGIENAPATIKSGTGTKSFTELLDKLSVIIISYGSSTASSNINIISSGIYLLDYFISKYGTTYVTGSNKDYLSLVLTYNKIDKRVYVKDAGQWFHTLYAQYVKINHIWSKQYYYNTKKNEGKSRTSNRDVSIVKKTSSYDSPYANALKAYNSHHFNEYIQFKVKSLVFLF